MNYIIDIDAHVFVPVYTINGHNSATILRKQFINKPGVYFIKENDKLVYVGCSKTSIYLALYRHFQRWNDSRGYPRMTYYYWLELNSYKIAVQTTLPEHAHNVESAYISKYKPRDNKYKLDAIDFEALMDSYPEHIYLETEVPF